MLTSAMENSYRGLALVRAADAMLRALGGEEVTLLFPATALPDDPAAQLGLADPGVEQVRIGPVVCRVLSAESAAPVRSFEFLFPATTVAQQTQARGLTTASAFFESALGIVRDTALLRVQRVVTEYFAGTAYLYRVIASE